MRSLGHPSVRTPRSLCLLAVGALSISGCVAFAPDGDSSDSSWRGRIQGLIGRGSKASEREKAVEPRVSNPPARTIRFDGHELVLGDSESAAASPAALRAEVERLLKEDRPRSAARLIARYADVAERWLWDSLSQAASTPDETLRQVAAAVDHAWMAQPDRGWSGLLERHAAGHEPLQAYFAARRTFVDQLQQGEATADAIKDLRQRADAVGHGIVTADAGRLTGSALLIAEKPQQAAVVLESSVPHTVGSGLHRASELLLLAAEAARRSGDEEAATERWQRAVEHYLTAIAQGPAAADSAFLNRAEHLRPMGAAWPESVRPALVRCCHDLGLAPPVVLQKATATVPVEGLLWAVVGVTEFERDQPQLAILALKKAESQLPGDLRGWAQLWQGKSMARLGQSAAATSLLVDLSQSSDRALAQAARAVFGGTRLAAGGYEQAIELLEKTLTEGNLPLWKGRFQAEADLGLSHLIMGDETQGLRWLHQAQENFARHDDFESLLQSWENEARYLESVKRSAEAKALRQRIAQAER